MFQSTGFSLLTFLVLLGGIIAHAAKQFQTARSNKATLTIKGYAVDNLPETVIAVIGSLVLWAGLPELATMFPSLAEKLGIGAQVGILSSFGCGFVGNSIADLWGGRVNAVALGD